MEKQKAKDGMETEQEIWELVAPEGTELDG